MRHRGSGCPREVIVQRSSKPLVAVKSGILQGLIETGDRSLVHLLVRPVAAVNPHDGCLITVPVGVRCWPTECLRPVRCKALGVLGVVSVAERMANHFVLQHPRVPRVGQPQQRVETARGFINRLHGFSLHSQIMHHSNKRERAAILVQEHKANPRPSTFSRKDDAMLSCSPDP